MTHDDRQFIQQLFETQTQQFQRHLSVVSESFDRKIGLIADGNVSLNLKINNLVRRADERFDLVDFKIDTLNEKVDGVAADFKAHRQDTEGHQNVYRVKEG